MNNKEVIYSLKDQKQKYEQLGMHEKAKETQERIYELEWS